MKSITLLIGLAVVFLQSCSTSYQPRGFTGGFTETQLAPDIARVSFIGNGYTSRDRAQDFALLRAAELALQAGYSYFAVINERNDTTESSFTTAGYSYTSGTAYQIGGGVNYSGTTTYVPGRTVQITSPESGLLVKFLKKQPQGLMTFDAAYIAKSLREKYKIKQA